MCKPEAPCGGATHERVHADGCGIRIIERVCLNGHVLARRGPPIPERRQPAAQEDER